MDYRNFLKPSEPLVLPFFGGTRVDTADRRLRLSTAPTAPGWWRFEIKGRHATPIERASPVDLSSLPAMRGHYIDGWVVASGRELGRIALPLDDEPAPLARVTARRWFSGDWLFDTADFEDDAELEARKALEERRALGAVKGVVPSLRAAFGYALGLATAVQLKIPMSIRELSPIVVEIADGGPGVVQQLFDDLVEERRREEAAIRERERLIQLANRAGTARVVERANTARERCDDALADARARMVGFRNRANNQVEVTYTVDGARIISIVDGYTLQVIDPGVCLGHGGEHRTLTLDAMPSVIREAIETHRLNILRH
jgi:hypothetical protein